MTTYLVEVENQIQLTDVPKERIQHLYEKVNRLKIRQLVIVRVYTDAEEQPGIATVDDFVVAELCAHGSALDRRDVNKGSHRGRLTSTKFD